MLSVYRLMDRCSEVRIRTETGVVLAVPAFPEPCSYVRVIDGNGRELAYWDHQEWKNDPEEVMGAIFGAICAGCETPESEPAYKVIMHNHRDPITDEPLFWSNEDGWVALSEATLFREDEEVNLPNEAWGTVSVGEGLERQKRELSAKEVDIA